MIAHDFYRFRNYLEREGISFCYSGYLTEQTLFGIGEAIKRKLEYDHAGKTTSRRIFSVFVEQVQNVIRYSEDNYQATGGGSGEIDLRHGVLTVGNQGDAYFVVCGNRIKARDVEKLRKKLTEIQGMDRSELKAHYKEVLRGETPEGSKGAGVGFLEIARQASRGIEFDFAEIDEEFAFFTLKAHI